MEQRWEQRELQRRIDANETFTSSDEDEEEGVGGRVDQEGLDYYNQLLRAQEAREYLLELAEARARTPLPRKLPQPKPRRAH